MQSFLASQAIISSLSDENLIVQAIFNGNADEVRSLIYKKEDVNVSDSERRTPLHAAAFLGDAEIIDLLILSGARINAKDSKWLTPLHRACASKSEDAVNTLLKHQADVNARDKLWQSPLHVAAANDAVACAELLIPQLSNLNFSDRAGRQALHHAAFSGHVNIVNLLIRNGANIHAYDRQERRALHWAAYMGHTEIIKALVAGGAEINCRDKRCGDTPMHAAAAAGQISAVKMFIDMGFDINMQNNQKCTPLHLACFNGQDVIVHELLEAGADANITNDQGCTSLHLAAASSHGALCLELLVNSGADVNSQNNAGKTPLHMTAVHGRFTRSQTLLHNGARADAVDYHGNSALHVAAKHGHELLITTLLEAGADPAKHGSGGKLAIHIAAIRGHVNCCRKLLNAHASEEAGITTTNVVAMCDSEGRSCLHYAACGGSLECLDVFLAYVDAVSTITQRDAAGRTPLHYALSSARRECAKRLITGALRREDFKKDLNDADKDGRTLLHHASATDANGGCVELLLERDVNVLATDNQGYTALHYAAVCGHDTVVKQLINADNNILKETHDEESSLTSPLHLGAYYGHISVVIYLAEYLLNLDIYDSEGRTPLELAAYQGNADCVRALQMQGACVAQRNVKNKRTALHAAASQGHTKCMQLLVEGALLDQSTNDGGDISRFINARDLDKCTPLMLSVTNGHLAAVDFLLSRNAFVWPVDKFGCTAIHRGAVSGNEDIVRNLIHRSLQEQSPSSKHSKDNDGDSETTDQVIGNAAASVVARSHNGRTPLHFAAIRGNASMLETLLQVAASVNVIDRYGYTPLHYACYEGHEPCVDSILLHDSFVKMEGYTFSPLHCAVYNDNEACADRLLETLGDEIVNYKDSKGRSPLHACVLNDNTDCAHFLLSHGSDPDSTDSTGQSPLMLACRIGHEGCTEVLLKAKANCCLVNVDNNNALHLACLNGNETCALILLDVVSDLSIINAQNNNGQSALHIAAKKGLTSVAMRLLEKGSNVDLEDADGLSPALACASNSNVADCLDMIIAVMLRVASLGSESFDLQSIRSSLESCRKRRSSLAALKRHSTMGSVFKQDLSDDSSAFVDGENTKAGDDVTMAGEDSDSETY
ncbi:unnamed protein product [Clavelina lepadiformis]|uniref:Serine/threonine-protein phosphatase 6 regulatory ankyrin repeat subunit A n=1 Tax=Clavelina lepadiformis TaxID=159417 RepID=A0ABP0GQ74_CLALP